MLGNMTSRNAGKGERSHWKMIFSLFITLTIFMTLFSFYGETTEMLEDDVLFSENISYPIVAPPVGLLGDGKELNAFLENGGVPNQYTEVIYLSTGASGRGVVDISPIDGRTETLKGGRIGYVIPQDFGPVVSSVRIYHDETERILGAPFDSVILITSTKGNVLAIDVHGSPPSEGISSGLYTITYRERWMDSIGSPISASVSIFYGMDNTSDDDRIIVVSDEGDVYSYDLDGNMKWNETLEGSGFYSAVCVDASDRIIIASRDGHFYGLDISTGNVLWSEKFEKQFSEPSLSAYYRDNYDENAVIYAGTDDGYLYGIRIYDSFDKKAGEPEIKLLLKKNSKVLSVLSTPDAPPYQMIYLTVKTSDNCIDFYGLKASELHTENYEKQLVEGIKGKNAKKPFWDPKITFLFFIIDNNVYVTKEHVENCVKKFSMDDGDNITGVLPPYNIPTKDYLAFPLLIVTEKGDVKAIIPYNLRGGCMFDPCECPPEYSPNTFYMTILVVVVIPLSLISAFLFYKIKKKNSS